MSVEEDDNCGWADQCCSHTADHQDDSVLVEVMVRPSLKETIETLVKRTKYTTTARVQANDTFRVVICRVCMKKGKNKKREKSVVSQM